MKIDAAELLNRSNQVRNWLTIVAWRDSEVVVDELAAATGKNRPSSSRSNGDCLAKVTRGVARQQRN